MNRISLLALACAAPFAVPAQAQEQMDHSAMEHGQMDHGQMSHGNTPSTPAGVPTDAPHDHSTHLDAPAPASSAENPHADHPAMGSMANGAWTAGSGTTRLPGAEGMLPMVMGKAGGWDLMGHAIANLNGTSAGGPRGDGKVYSTSMFMASATRDAGPWRVQFSAMMSAEPGMSARGYPNLFATGETAGGVPLVDRQHPHDLFMELTGRVDLKLAQETTVFLYGGPVGEPALGPSAFMHRLSASFNPEPPISHHWFDSTHISYGVVTAGVSAPKWQVEASGFRGREPDENRWDIEKPKLDSWSVRASLTPTANWAVQASYGEIKSPEATHPGQDEQRFTASVHYADGKGLTAMLGYSAKRRTGEESLPAWLAEANWNLDERNTVFGRVEHVANDELFADHHDPLHDQEFRITKLQAGYARRFRMGPFGLAVGASGALFLKPAALDAAYGKTPVQGTLFARIWLGK